MFWDKLKKKFLKIKWVYTPLQESFLYQPKWIAKKHVDTIIYKHL